MSLEVRHQREIKWSPEVRLKLNVVIQEFSCLNNHYHVCM